MSSVQPKNIGKRREQNTAQPLAAGAASLIEQETSA
jgi:hypothetical protein